MADTRIDEGFSTKIDVVGVTTPLYQEQEITPPEVDGGELIPTSHQRLTRYHTFAPQTLIKVGDCTIVVSAAIGAYAQLRAIVNINKQWTLTFPNGATQIFWGALKKVTPSAYKIGEQPKLTLLVGVTNVNASGVETGPVETAAP